MNYERLYEYRFRNVEQPARLAVWAEIAPFLFEQMGRPERVLDPAAGRCEFINSVPAAERWAVDEVAHTKQIADPKVKLLISDIMNASLPEGYFDGVFVSNFLEHLASQDAVAAFLEMMRECMAPNGCLAIMGPNFRYCAREYFDMADHTVILTHNAVAEHLYAAGFDVTTVTPRFLPYSFAGRLPPSPRLVRLYLRTPGAWRLLGKQFLVLGRKQESADDRVTPHSHSER
jgi:SAM-dependent methyltransferase